MKPLCRGDINSDMRAGPLLIHDSVLLGRGIKCPMHELHEGHIQTVTVEGTEFCLIGKGPGDRVMYLFNKVVTVMKSMF